MMLYNTGTVLSKKKTATASLHPLPRLSTRPRGCRGEGRSLAASFIGTAASCPPIAARVLPRLASATAPANASICLAIWDPLAAGDRGHINLPALAMPRRPRSRNAGLVCKDDPGGPFHVVLMGTDDLATLVMSVVHLPPASHNQRIALNLTEDGNLGFVRMEAGLTFFCSATTTSVAR